MGSPSGQSIEIEFALVGRPDSLAPGSIEPHEWEMPWEVHPRTVLKLDQTDSLASAISRAVENLGLTGWVGLSPAQTVGWIAFHDEHDPRAIHQRRLDELVLVDESGRALWVSDFTFVLLRQLIASAEAGTIQGDPHRIYLIRQVPQGDFFGMEWHQLLQLWEAAWAVLDKIDILIGIGGGAWAAKKAEARKARRAFEAARRASTRGVADWMRRDGKPDSIVHLIRARAWDSGELAGLLGLDEDEAEGLMEVLGSEKGDDGLFRPRGTRTDLLSRVDREIERAAERAMSLGFSPAVVGWSRERIERMIETGEEVPAEPVTLEDMGLPPEDEEIDDSDYDSDEDEFEDSPLETLNLLFVLAVLILAVAILVLGMVVALLVPGDWFVRLLAAVVTIATGIALVPLLTRLVGRSAADSGAA